MLDHFRMQPRSSELGLFASYGGEMLKCGESIFRYGACERTFEFDDLAAAGEDVVGV